MLNRSREPQPIILPALKKRYTTTQIEAASATTMVDDRIGNPNLGSSCGHPVEPGARFCGYCGVRR